MSLVPPQLDDRTFVSLRADALKRIQLYCPEWTDFNPSDPGVTLVELFAWFTEMLIHRMNKIPEQLHRELLDLVGVKAEPAKASTTVIVFEPQDNCPPTVAAFAPSARISIGASRPLVFHTTRELALVQRKLAAIARIEPGGGVDLTALNQAGDRGFDPFGEAGKADCEVSLQFVAADADRPRFVFPEIVTLYAKCASRRLEQNSQRANPPTERPRRPNLEWRANAGDGAWEPLCVLEDETDGFQNDGFIRIAGPRRAAAVAPLKAQGKNDKPVFELRCRVCPPGYSYGYSPRLWSLTVNAVKAIAQSVEINDELGVTTGLPGQIFTLRNRPVQPENIKLALLALDVELSTHEVQASELWTLADDLIDAGPKSQAFLLDPKTGQISFGDGRQGMIPPAGLRLVALRYLAGGGANTNVGKRVVKFALPGVTGLNPFPAEGGEDAEAATHLIQRAAARLRSRDRAVTASDYEDLAVAKGGAGRAKALEKLHPDYPDLNMPGVVTVFVAGKPISGGLAPPWASEADIERVSEKLNERRMVGCELFVRPAEIVPVLVNALVQAVEGLSQTEVKRAVCDSVNEWINKELGFGATLTATDLWSRIAQAEVKGVRAVRQIEMATFEIGPNRLGIGDKGVRDLKPYELPWGRPEHNISFRPGV